MIEDFTRATAPRPPIFPGIVIFFSRGRRGREGCGEMHRLIPAYADIKRTSLTTDISRGGAESAEESKSTSQHALRRLARDIPVYLDHDWNILKVQPWVRFFRKLRNKDVVIRIRRASLHGRIYGVPEKPHPWLRRRRENTNPGCRILTRGRRRRRRWSS